MLIILLMHVIALICSCTNEKERDLDQKLAVVGDTAITLQKSIESFLSHLKEVLAVHQTDMAVLQSKLTDIQEYVLARRTLSIEESDDWQTRIRQFFVNTWDHIVDSALYLYEIKFKLIFGSALVGLIIFLLWRRNG